MADLGYYIDVATPQGVRIAQMDNFLALNYARTVNDYGVMTLDLDPNTDRSLFRKHGRLGIWRHPSGGGLGLEFDTVWLVNDVYRVLKSNGERLLRIEAQSALWLITEPGRIVAYAAGSAQADKTATDADNMIKAFVRENMGALATDTARDWTAYVTVAADESLGTHVDKACSRRALLTVCQEIADQSQQLGYPLYFDIICPTYGTLEFRTWINQRGADRRAGSANPLILSPEMGAISEGEYHVSYKSEASFVYAGGQGEEALREIATASDTARIGSSPFGRREYFRDARQGATGDSLTAEAAAALYERRPRRLFSGSLTDTEQVKYGRDWRWGDRITAQDFGEQFDCEISAVKVSVSNGRETVQAALRAEEII
jgi:hypothetical protein